MSEFSGADFLKSPESLHGKMEVSFYFGSHHGRDEIAHWQTGIDQADIFIPELWGCMPEDKRLLAKLGKGDRRAYDRLVVNFNREPALIAMVNAIAGRRSNQKLEVEILDVPTTSKWLALAEQVGFYVKHVVSLSTLASTLEHYCETSRVMSEIQKERDEIITDNIREYLFKRVEDPLPPRPLQIFIAMGAFHTSIFERLKADNFPVSLADNSHGVLEPRDEIMRMFQNGEEPSEEEITRAFIASCLSTPGKYIEPPDQNVANLVLAKIAKTIKPAQLRPTAEQVVSIYNDVNNQPDEITEQVRDIFEELTGYRHMALPEIEEYLARPEI